jgi:hypothetical protein
MTCAPRRAEAQRRQQAHDSTGCVMQCIDAALAFLRVSGKRTSRKSTLYAQMMRCFSVCLFSQVGHLQTRTRAAQNTRMQINQQAGSPARSALVGDQLVFKAVLRRKGRQELGEAAQARGVSDSAD